MGADPHINPLFYFFFSSLPLPSTLRRRFLSFPLQYTLYHPAILILYQQSQQWLRHVSLPVTCSPLRGWKLTSSAEKIRTTSTDLLKINHPILLAGMNVAAGPKLAAAVTNAGGLGVIGGVGYTPSMLREQIAELKSFLNDKNAPFGVDLLLPQVGGSARKTKYGVPSICRGLKLD